MKLFKVVMKRRILFCFGYFLFILSIILYVFDIFEFRSHWFECSLLAIGLFLLFKSILYLSDSNLFLGELLSLYGFFILSGLSKTYWSFYLILIVISAISTLLFFNSDFLFYLLFCIMLPTYVCIFYNFCNLNTILFVVLIFICVIIVVILSLLNRSRRKNEY